MCRLTRGPATVKDKTPFAGRGSGRDALARSNVHTTGPIALHRTWRLQDFEHTRWGWSQEEEEEEHIIPSRIRTDEPTPGHLGTVFR
eukprot:7146053-Prymnesium_polylepis.1